MGVYHYAIHPTRLRSGIMMLTPYSFEKWYFDAGGNTSFSGNLVENTLKLIINFCVSVRDQGNGFRDFGRWFITRVLRNSKMSTDPALTTSLSTIFVENTLIKHHSFVRDGAVLWKFSNYVIIL